MNKLIWSWIVTFCQKVLVYKITFSFNKHNVVTMKKHPLLLCSKSLTWPEWIRRKAVDDETTQISKLKVQKFLNIENCHKFKNQFKLKYYSPSILFSQSFKQRKTAWLRNSVTLNKQLFFRWENFRTHEKKFLLQFFKKKNNSTVKYAPQYSQKNSNTKQTD